VENEHTWHYGPSVNEGTADSDITIILAAMVCALICSLPINWMVKCTRCYSSGMGADSSDEAMIRLINTGLRKAAMKALPIVVYISSSKPTGLASDFPICLTKFGEGEKVQGFPKCNHGFHMECIDKWLCSHSSFPMCRQSLNLLG
jgi:E3 ubiquitin-protein ligase ATL10/75/76/77/78